MRFRFGVGRWGGLLVLFAGLAAPAQASTFLRLGLEELSAGTEAIVLGEVVDAVSYWNADHSFILTDVTFAASETLKGARATERTVTLMGGTVGDRTVMIVGGAELVPGRSYLLFLAKADLPGAPQALTVRDHGQGAFEIELANGAPRAVSQANRAHLLADRHGLLEAPGGREGFALDSLLRELRSLVRRQQEVKR